MEETGVKRKLTVILAADVEGYSRLMGADEEATLKTLGAYRQIIDTTIAGHAGRVFPTAAARGVWRLSYIGWSDSRRWHHRNGNDRRRGGCDGPGFGRQLRLPARTAARFVMRR